MGQASAHASPITVDVGGRHAMTATTARPVRRSTRGLCATAVGALAALTVTACAGGDPLDDYLADMRATGAPAEVSDASLIVSGQYLCDAVGTGEIDPTTVGTEDPGSFGAALEYCDTAFAQPLSDEQRQRYGVAAFLAQSGFGDAGMAGEMAGEGVPDETDAALGEGFTERGNEEAEVGVEIESFGPPMAGEPSQWVTVNSIEEHTGACPAAADGRPVDEPENGTFYKVEMTVRNGAAYDAQQSAYYPGTAPSFDYVTTSGAAFDEVGTLPAFYCSGDDAPFYDLAPGRTYTGTVWVDLPDEPGYLILGQTMTLGTGYEFTVD